MQFLFATLANSALTDGYLRLFVAFHFSSSDFNPASARVQPCPTTS